MNTPVKTGTPIRSKLLTAKVLHVRMAPKKHRFHYPIFAVRLDIQELEQASSPLASYLFGVDQWRPLSVYRKDYGARDGSSLQTWAETLLAQHKMKVPKRIELHTMPRIFGYAFNPISIWYCYDDQDALFSVIAEVNNTFGEHHFYVLGANDETAVSAQTIMQSAKAMHVSPFCEVRGHYRFQFKETQQHAIVHIDYHEAEELTIKTAMASRKQILSTRTLLLALLRQPFLTVGVMWRIHWQAFLLWWKGVPFFHLPAAPKTNITLGTSLGEER